MVYARIFLCLLLACSMVSSTATANSVRRWQAKSALKTALESLRNLSTQGGYCGIYTERGMKHCTDEIKMKQMKQGHIWIEPPGTPSVGAAFLRAYRATKGKQFLEAAIEAGQALAWAQRVIGGWDYTCDISHAKEGDAPVRKPGRCTFDNSTTQAPLLFLISLDKEVDEKWLNEAVELGLEFVTKAQYPNGAWPQRYPLAGGYTDFYTFNQGVINDCIRLMLEAHKAYGTKKYLETAQKGGDFILASMVSGKQPGWAQQYSKEMKPAWGRPIEPPGLCSLVTARNINTLTMLYVETGDEKYLKPIPAAVKWLQTSKISDNEWSRLYEVESNKPIYGGRNRKILYSIDNLTEKSRTSYVWHGPMEVNKAIIRYNDLKKLGREAFGKTQAGPMSETKRAARAKKLDPEVMKAAGGLDPQGRWMQGTEIHISDAVKNLNLLCEYLEVTAPK
ncbi:pectate lyase [Planctomycetota bacterium]